MRGRCLRGRWDWPMARDRCSLPRLCMRAQRGPAMKVKGAPFAYEGLDRVIHERARLSVLTSLVSHPKGLSFVDLKELCALTDGNLSRHLKVLEEANLVE